MPEFDDLKYTDESLIKQFGLMQLHGTDGSAVDGGCSCIESKHTYLIEGLAEEGATLTLEDKRKKFYVEVGALARSLRRAIENEWFDMGDVLQDAGLSGSKSHIVEVKCRGPDCPQLEAHTHK